MNASTYLLLSLLGTNLLLYIIFLLTPNLSSSNIYMGILLTSEHRNSKEIKAIGRNFGIKCTLVFIIGLIISGLFIFFKLDTKNNSLIGLIIFLQTFFYLVCFAQANKKVLLYKKTLNLEEQYIGKVLIDTQFMQEKNKIKIFYKRLLLIPIGIAILLFIYCLVNYQQMPTPLPAHFDIFGNPDNWSDKKLVTVLFPSVFLILILVSLMGALNTAFSARNTLNKNYLGEGKTLLLAYLNGVARSICLTALSITLLIIGIVMATINGSSLNPFINYSGIILLLIALGSMFYASKKYKSKQPEKGGQEAIFSLDEQDKYWIWGMFYNNPNDPATFVNKRHGMGWTINFGSIKGKLFTLVTILLIIVIIIFSI